MTPSFSVYSSLRNFCFLFSLFIIETTLAQKPVLTADKTVHDYGEIENVSSLLSEFTLKNSGQTNLYILKADAPRGYTVEAPKKLLTPGETTTLTIRYRIREIGPFEATIKLFSNAGDDPLNIQIKGTVKSISPDPMMCFSFNTKATSGSVNPLHIRNKGTVINTKTRQPVASAKVRFVKGSSIIAETETYSNGTYEKILPLGLYHIEVVAVNYRDTSRQEYINRNSSPLVFELDPLPIPSVTQNTPITQPVSPEPVALTENPYDMPAELFKPNNVVFLIDISGSMKDSLKLPLLKHSVNKLITALRAIDKIALVTYAESARLYVPSMAGHQKEDLTRSINALKAKGFTAANKGIAMAHTTALSQYIENGNNEIILATDGVFKLSAADEKLFADDSLKKIKLSVVGFGTDFKSLEKLRLLAQKTDGSYMYIKDEQGTFAILQEIRMRSRK